MAVQKADQVVMSVVRKRRQNSLSAQKPWKIPSRRSPHVNPSARNWINQTEFPPELVESDAHA